MQVPEVKVQVLGSNNAGPEGENPGPGSDILWPEKATQYLSLT